MAAGTPGEAQVHLELGGLLDQRVQCPPRTAGEDRPREKPRVVGAGQSDPCQRSHTKPCCPPPTQELEEARRTLPQSPQPAPHTLIPDTGLQNWKPGTSVIPWGCAVAASEKECPAPALSWEAGAGGVRACTQPGPSHQPTHGTRHRSQGSPCLLPAGRSPGAAAGLGARQEGDADPFSPPGSGTMQGTGIVGLPGPAMCWKECAQGGLPQGLGPSGTAASELESLAAGGEQAPKCPPPAPPQR